MQRSNCSDLCLGPEKRSSHAFQVTTGCGVSALSHRSSNWHGLSPRGKGVATLVTARLGSQTSLACGDDQRRKGVRFDEAKPLPADRQRNKHHTLSRQSECSTSSAQHPAHRSDPPFHLSGEVMRGVQMSATLRLQHARHSALRAAADDSHQSRPRGGTTSRLGPNAGYGQTTLTTPPD